MEVCTDRQTDSNIQIDRQTYRRQAGTHARIHKQIQTDTHAHMHAHAEQTDRNTGTLAHRLTERLTYTHIRTDTGQTDGL